MSAPAFERPKPTPSRESQPYWDGLKERRLLIQHCTNCGMPRHYPRPVCPHCHSMESEFREVARGGAVHSWTVTDHPFNGFFKKAGPEIVALIDLDAGGPSGATLRVNAPLRGIAREAMAVGLRVRLVFEPVEEGLVLPAFEPE
ncbi:MAG: hypothetical protein FJX02_04885 [Alphaproteobacteria bacterium]|nr:hypothetical protein [Alphaproteobacteria bacterium]